MKMYEGILTEKVTVILDIGSVFTKCGFVGETSPRSIIRSQLVDANSGNIILMKNYKNASDLYEFLKSFMHIIFYKHLLVNPKDRRIVIVESMLSPTTFRETVAKVLFKHLEVSSVLFAPSHLMGLFTLGISSGVPMLRAWESIPVASNAIHKCLHKQLFESASVKDGIEDAKPLSGVMDSLSEDIVEDIKVRTCFVSPYERTQQDCMAMAAKSEETNFKKAKDILYPINKSLILNIPGKIRENCAEVLFEQDNDMKSITTLILDSLIKCPIDTRKELAENMIIMGGTAMLPGFKHRLLSEVKDLLKKERYSSKLAVNNFKVHSPPAKENNIAWLGASIFSDKEFLAVKSVLKKDYLEHESIPDWCNLKFNVLEHLKNL
ncbi:Actin-related protein 10 [Nymphon striatum]|nr:Actin-related protein 10 [Nymphon striatum]